MFAGAGSPPPGRRPPRAEAEARLSRLWMRAAVKLRKIDPELARRCELKGEYWAAPEDWSEARLRRARIAIQQVCRSARELL